MRISDWSSDVCSSDLPFTFEKEARQKGRTWSVFGELQVKLAEDPQLDLANRYTNERKSATWIVNSVAPYAPAEAACGPAGALVTDRKAVVKGKSVSVRVGMGVCRVFKKTKKKK